MSSPRHWNVRRHISRVHDGRGEPTCSFMMQHDRDQNSIAAGFNYPRPAFHRSGSGSYFYTQGRTSTKDQGSKTLTQSMDELIEPVKKLIEYRNLLNQLCVVDQQQQALGQFFYSSVIPSSEFERYRPATSAHPSKPISRPDFYAHIKATAHKFDLDDNS
jgi:hypothetical protein